MSNPVNSISDQIRAFAFSELKIEPGIPREEYLAIAEKMFPISQFPEAWVRVSCEMEQQKRSFNLSESLLKIFTVSDKHAPSFEEEKADFIDELSDDGDVTVQDQAWGKVEVKDGSAIEYPSELSRGRRLANYMLSYFTRVK